MARLSGLSSTRSRPGTDGPQLCATDHARAPLLAAGRGASRLQLRHHPGHVTCAKWWRVWLRHHLAQLQTCLEGPGSGNERGLEAARRHAEVVVALNGSRPFVGGCGSRWFALTALASLSRWPTPPSATAAKERRQEREFLDSRSPHPVFVAARNCIRHPDSAEHDEIEGPIGEHRSFADRIATGSGSRRPPDHPGRLRRAAVGGDLAGPSGQRPVLDARPRTSTNPPIVALSVCRVAGSETPDPAPRHTSGQMTPWATIASATLR